MGKDVQVCGAHLSGFGVEWFWKHWLASNQVVVPWEWIRWSAGRWFQAYWFMVSWRLKSTVIIIGTSLDGRAKRSSAVTKFDFPQVSKVYCEHNQSTGTFITWNVSGGGGNIAFHWVKSLQKLTNPGLLRLSDLQLFSGSIPPQY